LQFALTTSKILNRENKWEQMQYTYETIVPYYRTFVPWKYMQYTYETIVPYYRTFVPW
jgi:hypothetical protein